MSRWRRVRSSYYCDRGTDCPDCGTRNADGKTTLLVHPLGSEGAGNDSSTIEIIVTVIAVLSCLMYCDLCG